MRCAIVTTSSDLFALPATVMLRSLADHLSGRAALDVYVLDCGISPASRRKMKRSLSPAWLRLHFISMNPDDFAGFRDEGHFSLNTYARLFVGRLLPDKLERIVFLDGDMLLLDDVAALAEMDLQGRPLAAVQDPVAGRVGRSAQMMHWQGWDVPEGTSVFNAGLMVMDLRRLRAEGTLEAAIEVARQHPERMQWHDQDALNYVLRGNYLEIDPAWNVGPFVFYPPHNRDVVYDPETVARCIREPKILHYGGTWRPWKGPGRHWREAEFYRYLYRTAWRNDVYCAPWMGRGNTVWTKMKRMVKRAVSRS
ncbi:MAG: glycosyltransferase family 8 protein [Kiritimatiellia bacterium]